MSDRKKPKNFIYYDTSKTYICPMIRKDSKYPNEIHEPTEVKIEMDRYGYFLRPLSNEYHFKYFYDQYLRWLFYTNYIKEKVEND